MRVLFCESLPMWFLTLPQGFRALGYETAFSGPITRERLQSLFFQFRPDLVVSLGWGREHSPEKIQLVREAVEVYGAVHAYWALEDPNYFEGWSLPYVRKAGEPGSRPAALARRTGWWGQYTGTRHPRRGTLFKSTKERGGRTVKIA